MTDIHQAAAVGFGTAAGTYSQGRPDYPAALQAWLGDVLHCSPGTTVIDLGAGTGKFTRLLQAMALRVVGVEPVAAMRAEFSRQLPGGTILDGTATAIPLADGAAQAIVCAQAFHWFAQPAALAEMHRVLAPAGRLGLVWNVRDESVDWVAAISDILRPHEGDTPRYHNGGWRLPFQGRYFTAPELTCFDYTHVGSPADVIMARFLSVSFIAALPAAHKASVAQQLTTLIQTHPALRGRERIAFPYQTHAYLCRRLD